MFSYILRLKWRKENKVMTETYQIDGWEEEQTGMLLFENENWVLVRHIPVDYQADGFRIYSKKWIRSRTSGENEAFIDRVLQLKKTSGDVPPINLGSAHDILSQLESRYGLFEFQEGDEEALFYGKLKDVNGDDFTIDAIDPKAEIVENYDEEFSFSEIRSITFETDYFESMRVLMIDNRSD